MHADIEYSLAVGGQTASSLFRLVTAGHPFDQPGSQDAFRTGSDPFRIAPSGSARFCFSNEEAHFRKFGSIWELSKKNPVW